MWSIEGAQESGEKSGPILQFEVSSKSDVAGESEIVWMRLYPNQWGLVNNNRGF